MLSLNIMQSLIICLVILEKLSQLTLSLRLRVKKLNRTTRDIRNKTNTNKMISYLPWSHLHWLQYIHFACFHNADIFVSPLLWGRFFLLIKKKCPQSKRRHALGQNEKNEITCWIRLRLTFFIRKFVVSEAISLELRSSINMIYSRSTSLL